MILEKYAQWLVDFVKADDLCNTNAYPNDPYSAQREIELIRSAIDRCGRSMTLSLSPGPAVIEKAWHLARNANMWRITDDFWNEWRLLLAMFERCEVWQAHVREGCWPDCDMLPLGRIGIAHRNDRKTRLTPEEQKTMMTLWCIFRSPLFLGGELRDTDRDTLRLISNPEVIAVNRQGRKPRQIARDSRHAVWTSENDDGSRSLALFNLSDTPLRVRCLLSELGACSARLRDLWARADLGLAKDEICRELPPHGAGLLKVSAPE